MRLKIVNTTGHARDTQIVDAVSGERLQGVMRVDIHIEPHNYVTATLYVHPASIDLVAEAELVPPMPFAPRPGPGGVA